MSIEPNNLNDQLKERMMDNALDELVGGRKPHGLPARILRAAADERTVSSVTPEKAGAHLNLLPHGNDSGKSPSKPSKYTLRERFAIGAAAAAFIVGMALIAWPQSRPVKDDNKGVASKIDDAVPKALGAGDEKKSDGAKPTGSNPASPPEDSKITSLEFPKPVVVRRFDDVERLPADTQAIMLENMSAAEWTKYDRKLRQYIEGMNIATALAKFRELRWLDFSRGRSYLKDGDVASWGELSNLEYLNFQLPIGPQGRLTDAALEHLGKLPNLKTLKLRQSGKYTDVGFRHLASLKQLTELDLTACGKDFGDPVTDQTLEIICGLSRLRHLSLEPRGVTETGLKRLAKLELLEELNIGIVDLGNMCNSTLTDNGIAHLAALPKLTAFNVSFNYQVTDAALAHIGKIANLKKLDIRGCVGSSGIKDRLLGYVGITDKGLEHLAGLNALEELNLSLCTGVTDVGLPHLAKLTALKTLRLEGCEQVTDIALSTLANALPGCRIIKPDGTELAKSEDRPTPPIPTAEEDDGHIFGDFIVVKKLETIAKLAPDTEAVKLQGVGDVLNGSGHGDEELTAIVARCPKLRKLDLSGPRPTSGVLSPVKSSVGDDGLKCLGTLLSLESLNLSRCGNITSDGIKYLPKTLRSLNLYSCTWVTDAALARIGNELAGLEELVLGAGPYEAGADITDAGLEHLARIRNLRQLAISQNCRITGQGIASLVGLPLEELDLSACQKITDTAVPHLAKLPTLKLLNLVACEISDDQLAGLAAALHGCRIVRTYDPAMVKTRNELHYLPPDVRVIDIIDQASGGLTPTDADMELLGKCECLESLSIRDAKLITAIGVAHLAGLEKLKTLSLVSAFEIDDDGLAAIGKIRSLVSLCLYGPEKISAKGLCAFAELKLKSLSLANCSLDDIGLLTIFSGNALDTFQISNCGTITDAGWKDLKDSQSGASLKELIVSQKGAVATSQSKLTDNALLHITGMKNLQTLDVSGLALTDTALPHIAGLKNLQKVDFSRCLAITDTALAKLAAALPDCPIIIKPDRTYMVRGTSSIFLIENDGKVSLKDAVTIVLDDKGEKAVCFTQPHDKITVPPSVDATRCAARKCPALTAGSYQVVTFLKGYAVGTLRHKTGAESSQDNTTTLTAHKDGTFRPMGPLDTIDMWVTLTDADGKLINEDAVIVVLDAAEKNVLATCKFWSKKAEEHWSIDGKVANVDEEVVIKAYVKDKRGVSMKITPGLGVKAKLQVKE